MAIFIDERVDLKEERKLLKDIFAEPIKSVKILERKNYKSSRSYCYANLGLSNKWIESEDFNRYIYHWMSLYEYKEDDKLLYSTIFLVEYLNDMLPWKINCLHYCKLYQRLYNMATYGVNSHELTLVSIKSYLNP